MDGLDSNEEVSEMKKLARKIFLSSAVTVLVAALSGVAEAGRELQHNENVIR